jgi:hypothetical protein
VRTRVCTANFIPAGAQQNIYHRSKMIALMCFCLRLFTLPVKSKIRLEAENAILRLQLVVLERKIRGAFPSPIGSPILHLALSLVSLNVVCASDHQNRDPGAVAPCRFSTLLALEVPIGGHLEPQSRQRGLDSFLTPQPIFRGHAPDEVPKLLGKRAATTR